MLASFAGVIVAMAAVLLFIQEAGPGEREIREPATAR